MFTFAKNFIVFNSLLLVCTSPISSYANTMKSYMPRNLLVAPSAKIMPIRDNKKTLLDIIIACSLTSISSDLIVFVNYQNMFLLNKNTGETKILEKPEGVDVWCPTGVKWCEENKTIYLANYKGHDVLLLKLIEGDKLILVKRYSDPELIGPENIDVIDGGKLFCVADFDANKVIVFSNGKKLWSRAVARAHGVAFTKDKVEDIIATGLFPSKVYKFDLRGNLLAENGKEGWSKDEYLWPTGVAVKGDIIAITDAHTGKISFVDDTLVVKRTIGGNGPGVDLFNMPYGIEFTHDDYLLVIDTFKGRILKINPSNGEIALIYEAASPSAFNQKTITMGESNTTTGAENLIKRTSVPTTIKGRSPLGMTYKERTNLSSTVNIGFYYLPDKFGTKSWHPGYNRLIGENEVQLLLENSAPLFSSSIYYWIDSQNYKYNNFDFLILGSPEVGDWLVLHKGVLCLIKVGVDFWIENNALVSSRGERISFKELANEASVKIEKYLQSVRTGDNPLQAMAELLGTSTFKERFALAFSSEPGKKMRDILLTTSSPNAMYKAAAEYLQAVKDDKSLYFVEIAVANAILQGMEIPLNLSK